MHINELVKEAHDLAKEKGWYDTNPSVPERLAAIHSEISEAFEEFRCGRIERYYKPADPFSPDAAAQYKPEGFGTELADAVIRIADLCGHLGIDLEDMVQIKHGYNKTRSYRHGGKIA